MTSVPVGGAAGRTSRYWPARRIAVSGHRGLPGPTTDLVGKAIRGTLAEPGTYVYMALIRFTDGRQQLYKGTLVLIR